MPGEAEPLGQILTDVKQRFALNGFRCRITVDDTGSQETIDIHLVRDNTYEESEKMIT